MKKDEEKNVVTAQSTDVPKKKSFVCFCAFC